MLLLTVLPTATFPRKSESLDMSHLSEGPLSRLEELERLLEQRTAEAQEAGKELDDFSYSVSHDLRAPLRHINGYAKIILEDFGDKLDPQCLHFFENIHESASKMAAMLEDLTKISRIGRQELLRQTVPLDSLVQEVVRAVADETVARHIEWKIGPLPQMNCDVVMMKQLFLQLFTNAAKFTRPRDHAVIEAGTVESNGGKTIFIRDNGIGFDMKHSDRLFTIFQRLHSQHEYEGLGSGLALAQRIIKKHGGRIWAEAAVNQGASFYFTLDGQPQGH
jgi:light-regulated signal transduction histidine kinase (bacteriophytochrome)